MRSIMIWLLVLLAAVNLTLYYWTNHFKKPTIEQTVQQDSNVLLEKIRRVYKLIVVEGDFVDVVSYKSYVGYDLPGLRKKALLKVKARVSVGYDLNQLKITTDQAKKIIRVENLPQPQIMSLDPEVSFYDLDQGMFNSFTPEEMTALNKAAKDSITASAYKSPLMQVAKNQASEMIQMITFLAQDEGWKVELPANIAPPPPISPAPKP